MLLRRFLPSSRRVFEPIVGLVGRRGTGRVIAARKSSIRRSTASARLRSWVRKRCAWITITPSLVMRWPASRLSRASASAGSVSRLVSKRSWAAVESLLTFCPPGPEARTKLISMSFSSIVRSREIRSMASLNLDGSWRESGRHRIAVVALKREGGVPRMLRSAISAFTRVFDALFLRRGALLIRAHDWQESMGSRLCGAPPRGAAPRPGHEISRKPSVRPGRRRGGGVRGAADDHGEETLPPQPPGGLFGIVEGHGIDDGVALLDVVDGQLVELILQQCRGQLRRGVKRQHLRALQIGLGLIQLLLGRAILGHATDFLLDGVNGLAGAVGAGAGIYDEYRGVIRPQHGF